MLIIDVRDEANANPLVHLAANSLMSELAASKAISWNSLGANEGNHLT